MTQEDKEAWVKWRFNIKDDVWDSIMEEQRERAERRRHRQVGKVRRGKGGRREREEEEDNPMMAQMNAILQALEGDSYDLKGEGEDAGSSENDDTDVIDD
eukprot:TRINITY_DN1446_c0_g1_i3.p2 TRINITY_DN1446_c0_g1~~TRINITY_DN1446_c0_g1_i3.p2  ORF type:complete len:100 (-),score=35.19 TRINITY_DN1446_c0_g1_i3:39-338(-)